MISIQVICLGKLKEKFYAQAVNEYLKRLTPYAKMQIIELPETAGETDIMSKVQSGTYLIPMCIEGDMLSSEALADKISSVANRGISKIAFFIGGSEGLPQGVKDKGDLKLSMSRMTFPHHFARVMVLEQIYRAFKINEGGKYHK